MCSAVNYSVYNELTLKTISSFSKLHASKEEQAKQYKDYQADTSYWNLKCFILMSVSL